MSNRIYTVRVDKSALPDHAEVLVKAASQSQALKHVVGKLVLECALSTQDELVELASNGAKVEVAKEPSDV